MGFKLFSDNRLLCPLFVFFMAHVLSFRKLQVYLLRLVLSNILPQSLTGFCFAFLQPKHQYLMWASFHTRHNAILFISLSNSLLSLSPSSFFYLHFSSQLPLLGQYIYQALRPFRLSAHDCIEQS